MRLNNAALIELQPTRSTSSSVAVQQSVAEVTTSSVRIPREELAPKRQRTNLENLLGQFGGNITINLNNVTAPINMFNQASGHRSNDSVILDSPGKYYIIICYVIIF
jgi:hypothetical protein